MHQPQRYPMSLSDVSGKHHAVVHDEREEKAFYAKYPNTSPVPKAAPILTDAERIVMLEKENTELRARLGSIQKAPAETGEAPAETGEMNEFD